MQKAGIKTVHVESRIDCLQGMRFGEDQNYSSEAVLSSMIIDSFGQKGIARMNGVMQTNGIVVADLVRSNVVSRIQQYRELQLTDENSEGAFVVKILQYGFNLQLHGKVPFVILRAELLDRQGKRIWSRTTTKWHLTSKGIGASWKEYEANPEKLRADWNKQIETVVSHLFPINK